jgi:DNA ligase (NAD+)
MPTQCPACGERIVKEGVYYRCKNKNCPALKRENLSHFVSRGAFNIEGLGPKILNKLYDEGLVQDKADIFSLEAEDIAPLEGLGEKSAKNIIDAIEKTKKAPLERFIYSLGILHVGVETAYDLAQYFGNIEKIEKTSIEKLEAVPNIGEVVARSIYDWFNNSVNLKLIEKFKNKGLVLVNPKTNAKSQNLKDLTFVFTGTMEKLSRDDAEQLTREHGGKASSSVSKKTNYVVAGENPGSKYEEAKKLGVKVINKKEFLRLVG